MALGAEELRIIGAACRRESTGQMIIRDMNKEIRRGASKRIREEVRAAALASFPSSGGLNIWIAKAPIRLNIRRGFDSAGVTVRVGRRGHDFRSLDSEGLVRHPLYGDRSRWYTTAVKREVITNSITREGSGCARAGRARGC
jgi:hypothetical protein